MAYFYLEEQQRSVDDASEAIRLDPQLSLAYTNRAEAYEALGLDAEAERDLDQARKLKE